MPRVTVIMPTFEQAAFLARSIGSLLAQTVSDWELVIVDDGSCDATPKLVQRVATDPRMHYHRLHQNTGMGAALNVGLGLARAPFISYLPTDDLYDPDHLAALLDLFADDGVEFAWSDVRHGDFAALTVPGGFPLQLVQVMHRRTPDRWVERSELESDDLDLLFWSRLRRRGAVRGTGRVTCTWTDHPAQRHKAMRERYDGGLNVFRYRYRISEPLRLHSSDSGTIDEKALYRRFRDRTLPRDDNQPAVILVGELSYHADRVLALAERGVRLYGLWTPDGLGIDTVGPLPFGHVTELPRSGWAEAVRALRPAVIYAQLNWRAVPFAAAVRDALPSLPYVWHFKESPQRSLARGEWPQLAALCLAADAVVFSSLEERDWFELSLPARLNPARTLVLDGSLPKADWFDGEPATRLSEIDGEVHTCVLARPLGFDAEFVKALAAHRVHVHFHGLRNGPGPQGQWTAWLDRAGQVAPGFVHVHPPVDAAGWVRELSRYDAGWLHRVPSSNAGDLRRASWDDLNPPARIGPLLAAGLPMLQQRHAGNIVTMDRLVADEGIGLLYDDVEDVCAQLTDEALMARVREQVGRQRPRFTFDSRIGPLLELFHELTRGDRRA
jgi:glycosyltransferase involved in cell wall biosynthesis